MEETNYLEEYHEETMRSFLPVIIVMAVICVLGILGNAFTIAFYGFASRKSPTVFMITVLACVDLIVCVLLIPNMAEMGVNVKYTNAGACKVMHFFGHWTIESSALILWFISIDRYRHVCCQFRSQVNFVKAKVAMGIIIFVSFLLSVRDFANFGIIEFLLPNVPNNTTHIFGHYCTTTDDPNFKVSVTFFHALDALVVVMILVTLAFTYGRIIWTLRKEGFHPTNSKHNLYKENQKTTNSSKPSIEDIKEESSADTSHTTADEQVDDPSNVNKNNSLSGHRDTTKHSGVSSTKLKTVERSVTIMMFAVSVAFAICFIPYFVVKLGIRNVKSASQLELGAGIQFVIRFTYVNSFANPYIFCMFNPQFRRFVRNAISWEKFRSIRKDNKSSKQGTGTEETRTSQ